MAHELEYVDPEYQKELEAEAAEAAQAAAERQMFENDLEYHERRAISYPQDAKAKHSQWWLMRFAA